MEKNLNNNVSYQEDSVVSREIIKKDVGTVTLFAFDKGQGLSEHTAPYDALIIITDGEGEVTLSGKKHMLGTGDMLLMSAGEGHKLFANKRFKMLLVMIREK